MTEQENIEFCCPLLDSSVSGSPIIQDEKLSGAMTHVFLQDAPRKSNTPTPLNTCSPPQKVL